VSGTPSPNGNNGSRDSQGRFVAGNAGGPGNPYARRVARLRSLMLEAVSEEDLLELIQALIGQAKSGDLAAIREVLDRCLGKAGRIEQADPDRVDLNEGLLLAEDQAQQARSVAATGGSERQVDYWVDETRSEPEKLADFLNEVESLADQWDSLELPVSELLAKLRRLMPDDVVRECSRSAPT
jgi:hypothetical protein